MPRRCHDDGGLLFCRAIHTGLLLTTLLGASLTTHAVEPGFNPELVPSVPSVSPYEIRSLDYDTDGDGVVDYRVVGDFNGNGILEWDDIQAALDGLCDPNGDGKQDATDGKLMDLDGNGVADEPFCGTLHILPGQWISRTILSWNPYDKKDDQIWLTNYQGLWFRGSGVDVTILRTVYDRIAFCRRHHEAGCGGVCSRESAGFLTLSDFTFEGLDPRNWGKKDCDGDGLDYDNPAETDYKSRVLQTGVVVFNNPPNVGRHIKLNNIKVTKADHNGFALGEIEDLYAANLSVFGAGAMGILFAGIQNSYAQNIYVENVNGLIAAGGITINTTQVSNGQPDAQMTKNFIVENVTSLHNHMGIEVQALGGGGTSDVTIRNFHVIEPRVVRARTYTEYGLRLQDNGCLWDSDRNGVVDNRCYLTNVTFENGDVTGAPAYGFSGNMAPLGPDRNVTVRAVNFTGNGWGIGGPDSRAVDIDGIPGTVFEYNTVTGSDYNSDGIADTAHLVRGSSNNVVIRNNTIQGTVSGGVQALVQVRGTQNARVTDNIIACETTTSCTGIYLWSDALGSLVADNRISHAWVGGVGILAAGSESLVQRNEVTGGQYGIDSPGNRNQFVSNILATGSLSPSGYGIRFQGSDGDAADNTCKPASTTQYCIEIEQSAVGTTLQNNRNLTNPFKVYLDKRINPTPPPPPSPPPPLPMPAEPPATESPAASVGGSSSAPSESGSGGGGGGCTLVKTGNFDPTLLIVLLTAFTSLVYRRDRTLSCPVKAV